jgi:hypothetical protein
MAGTLALYDFYASRRTDSYQLRNTISDKHKLYHFLNETLPDRIEPTSSNAQLKKIRTKDDFIEDAVRSSSIYLPSVSHADKNTIPLGSCY